MYLLYLANYICTVRPPRRPKTKGVLNFISPIWTPQVFLPNSSQWFERRSPKGPKQWRDLRPWHQVCHQLHNNTYQQQDSTHILNSTEVAPFALFYILPPNLPQSGAA